MTYRGTGIGGQVSTPRTGFEPVPLVVPSTDPNASGETTLLPKYPTADRATYDQFMLERTRTSKKIEVRTRSSSITRRFADFQPPLHVPP